MRLEDVGNTIPLAALGADHELVGQIQQLLTTHGYLDPPADGKFGPVSHWALAAFARRNQLSTDDGLTSGLARSLLDTAHQPLPQIKASGVWFDKVLSYMKAKEYWICRHPDAVNICYLEGANADGTLNNNKNNVFNDLRIVFWIAEDGTAKTQMWEGTTEPGLYWTVHPMDPKGAARIAFDQYKAWIVGTHHAGKPSAHEALVQVEPILVYRDLNQDFKRQGDQTYRGLFAINQHWGYDAPKNDLGTTSAGCLVGRTKSGHREFMKIVKSDSRHLASPAYRFVTAVMPGSDVLV
jgi:peptidoglycan hydrolase-like protein with peptidoglycan-binding domain